MDMTICEKCGALSVYDPYFGRYICSEGTCGHSQKKGTAMEQKTIRQLIESLRDDTQYKPTDICKRPMFYLDAEAGKAIADALEATMWIPCEERLPEESGTYLASRNGHVSEAWWNSGKDPWRVTEEPRWEFECIRCNPIGDGVVAWMPMPKPYEPTKPLEAIPTSTSADASAETAQDRVDRIVRNVTANMRAEGFSMSADTERECRAVASGKESAERMASERLAPTTLDGARGSQY